jgi:hypothetical protein
MRTHASRSVIASAAKSKESATMRRLSRAGSPWLCRVARRMYSSAGWYVAAVGGYQLSTRPIPTSARANVLSAASAWS